MNVTDTQRASSGALLVVGSLAASVGLTLLFYAVGALAPGGSDSPFRLVEEGLWLIAMAVLVVGLLQLAAGVDGPLWLQATAMGFIVSSLLDALNTLLVPKVGLGGPWFFDLTMLMSLVARGLLLFCLVRLTMKTHAWVMPLLGTVAVIILARTAFSVASIHRLVPNDLYLSPLYRYLMPLVSLFTGLAILVAALAMKAAVAGTPNTPALVAAAGLQPGPAQPTSPVADFLVGGILLAVGVGVTMVSLAAASDGGRYVVATGAIGVGLVRVVRGFVRLGRA